jgi:hypothetical protein
VSRSKRYRPLCRECERRYSLSAVNAALWLYSKQPWFNHLVSSCPCCLNDNLDFVDEELGTKLEREVIGLPVEELEYADDFIVRVYEAEMGITPLETRPLTADEETLVAFFRVLIEADPNDLQGLPTAWETDL